MSQEDRETSLCHGEGAGGWVRLQPGREAIVGAVTDATDLTAEDVGAHEDSVDESALRELLDGDERGTVVFEVEGYGTTGDGTGNVTIGSPVGWTWRESDGPRRGAASPIPPSPSKAEP